MNKRNNILIIAISFILMITLTGCGKTSTTDTKTTSTEEKAQIESGAVKEFEIESFTKVVDGKYFPQFSIKELTVNKGDLVRLKINTTSGKHDLKIDELNVYSETPTGELTVIEFTADKVGEFVYWCTKPRHRELGHWGTLTIVE